MKKFKLILIIGLAFLFLGCSKSATVNQATTPTSTYYERLSTTDRKKVQFKFTATAQITAESDVSENRPQLYVDGTVTNKTKKIVKLDLAHFRLVNVDADPYLTKVLTVKPGETKKVTGLFRDVRMFPVSGGITVSYFAGKYELDRINKVSNQSELNQWVLKQDTNHHYDSTTPLYSDAQLIAWVGHVLTEKSNGQYSSDDYYFEISRLGAHKVISVRENHDSNAMKAAGADPETSPIVYQLFVNDKGQLEDYATHEIFSKEYPK